MRRSRHIYRVVTTSFCIGKWLVEPDLGTVSDGETEVRLEPRSMAVLQVLASRPKELVSKAELISQVWHQSFVSDEVLTHAIWELRKAFKDNARRPRYIQTIPKKGYRLVEEVEKVRAESIDQGTGIRRHWKRLVVVALVVVGLVLAGRVLDKPESSSPDRVPAFKRLIVLPLTDEESGNRLPIAAGITESLTRSLGSLEGLSVIAIGVAERYSERSHEQIRSDLAADYILAGRVFWFARSRQQSRVRIALELIATDDAAQVWSKSFDRSIEDPFVMMPELTQEISDQLAPMLGLSSDLVAANKAYLAGLAYKIQPSFEHEDMIRAVKLFQRSLERNPNFVAAWAELSKAHSLLAFNGDSQSIRVGKAEEALERGRRIEPDDPGLAIAEAFLEYHGRKSYGRARAQFERLAAALPRQPEVAKGFGLILRRMGSFDLAIEQLEIAFELQPRAGLAGLIAETYRAQRRWKRAQSYYELALDLNPDSPTTWGESAINLFDATGSVTEARNHLARFPNDREPFLLYYWLPLDLYSRDFYTAIDRYSRWPRSHNVLNKIENPWHVALAAEGLGQTQRATHLIQENRLYLEELTSQFPEFGFYHAYLAQAYAFLGEPNRARASLEKAMELYHDDSFSGPRIRQFGAIVDVLLGNHAAAIAELSELMSMEYQHPLSRARLLTDPMWEPLRREPGFTLLLEEGTHELSSRLDTIQSSAVQ